MSLTCLGFTAKYHKVVRELKSETQISQAFDLSSAKDHPPFKIFNAIWDTGATITVISRKVIEECQLEPIGMTEVHHCGGTSLREIYLINIVLRNNVIIPQISVIEGTLGSNIDVLIGMDIICLGDFAISNKNNETTFSFRIPSVECIDFGKPNSYAPQPQKTTFAPQTHVLEFQPKTNRNAPCPCGSGKKYKKCCGE